MQLDEPVKHKRTAGVCRMRKHPLKTDMTPMVDLGFLLITFFIFTTEMNKPTMANLYMPKQGPPTLLRNSDALTILLGPQNTIYYYEGDWENAKQSGRIFTSNYSDKNGIGKLIREKQNSLAITNNRGEGASGLMLLIKPGKEASYKNLSDMLDEITINQVGKYALVSLSAEESKYLGLKIQN
jgi:biopolymer transport protein ExbD